MSETTPSGGGLPIPKEYAEAMLRAGWYDHKGLVLMCKEYGESQCEECEEACTCWNGITPDDLNEDGRLDDDLQHFELWK
jgi:hypothetical protein